MTALSDLASLRAMLVGMRRDMAAEAIAPGADRALWSEDFAAVQTKIEAVDRAIIDEGKRSA